jgi:excisionase family DNA binding protein
METIKATAKIFGLPEYFIRQKVLSGEIVAVQAGRKYLVNVDKFAEYLNAHTLQSAETDNKGEQVQGIRPVPVHL